jgi:hypothetical protein
MGNDGGGDWPMKGKRRIRSAGAVLPAGTVLAGATPAAAVPIGNALTTTPNGVVCGFQSPEPRTRPCTVGQDNLLADHTATSGPIAPGDGVIVSWSTLSGTAPPGTGSVRLSLRAFGPLNDPTAGPQVDESHTTVRVRPH